MRQFLRRAHVLGTNHGRYYTTALERQMKFHFSLKHYVKTNNTNVHILNCLCSFLDSVRVVLPVIADSLWNILACAVKEKPSVEM